MDFHFGELLSKVETYLTTPLDPFGTPKQILAFEAELSNILSTKEAIAVSSGTAALHCALAALNIGPGDEVLVPALSVVMSVAPVLYLNATPVFVDSGLRCIDFDYADLERKISPKSKAILPVYLWGCSYDMPRLTRFAKRNGLAIVEDACQAHGTKWSGKYLGTWGDLGCFSMRDGKLISTGEGGFIVTDDTILAERCRSFRNHWVNTKSSKLSYSRLGWNFRLTELQALLGRWQINHFEEILSHRQQQTQYVLRRAEGLRHTEPYEYRNEEESNYFSPVLLLRDQIATKRVADELSRRGVVNSVGTFGMKPVQEQPVFKRLSEAGHHMQVGNEIEMVATPNAGRFLERVLALTLLPHYSEADLEIIIETLEAVLVEITDEDLL